MKRTGAVAYFCRTSALAKSKRMSYSNMRGEKRPVPLHTLHMDALGEMRVKGLYDTAGHVDTLTVVNDVIAYK